MICESWPWTVYIYLCSSEYPGIFGGKIYIHLALADLLYPIWYALSVYQRWCICLRTCLESQYKRFILQAYLLWGNGEMKQTKPSRLVEVPLKQSQQNEVLHCFLICHGLITYDCSHREPMTGFKRGGGTGLGRGVKMKRLHKVIKMM